MKIAIYSGELSGDRIGAALALALRTLCPQVELRGVGSRHMREAGVELLADSASWGAISITESLAHVPSLLWKIAPLVRKELTSNRPDVVVLIDFGAFNIRLARYCKSIGLKVCYYFPPGAWKRSGTVSPELAQLCDLILTPFPWSLQRYLDAGARAEWVGHPVLDIARPALEKQDFYDQLGLNPDQPVVGLLPGSRAHELKHLMPALVQAARKIAAKEPSAQFVVGVAPTLSPEQMYAYLTSCQDLRARMNEIWHELSDRADRKVLRPLSKTAEALTVRKRPLLATQYGVLAAPDSMKEKWEKQLRPAESAPSLPPTVLAKNLTAEVMAYSHSLLVCSGTATLEAAVFGTPMIIAYRGSRVMEMEYRMRGLHRKIRYIGLPNIVLNRMAVPELIQEAASPENLAQHTLCLLQDLQTRAKMRADLQEVRTVLGEPGASMRAAQRVLSMVEAA